MSGVRAEALVATRHAVSLGISLAMTTALALGVRLLIPRLLGPGAFGELRLAESMAEMLFVALTFGVDMQLRREAAVNASGAWDSLMGLSAVRLTLGALAIALVSVALHVGGASPSLLTLFALTALGQILLVLNNSYAALEQAAGDVSWLARTNLGVKLLWATATIMVLFASPSGAWIAMAALGVEGLRFAWLTARASRTHGLRLRPDLGLATGAILTSLPFFVNNLAHNLYARIGTGWLGAVRGDVEVGLYGAAANLATVALLGMPLLSWVLVPSAARAASTSQDSLDQLCAGALRLSLLLAVPAALTFTLGAEPILLALFGPEYLAAAPVLRILAPTFGLAYVSTVCAIALLQEGRTWTVAGISLGGVALTVALDAALIPWGARHLGAAGGAQGAAWATLGTELAVTVMLALLSRRLWTASADLRRTARALATGLAALILVVAWVPAQGVAGAGLGLAAFAMCVAAFGGVTGTDFRFLRDALAPIRHSTSLSLETS